MDFWTTEQRQAFGIRLREERKRNGMTLVEVGAMFDTSKQTVNHWEAGRSMPSAEQVARLADEYGCALDWLLYGRPATTFTAEIHRHLAAADAETMRKLENHLRTHFDLEPLKPADQAPLAKTASGKPRRAA